MDNSEAQAFPVAWGSAPPILGMTKREYFAAMAMQGLIATGREQTAPWGLAHDAVCCADSLLAALARKDTP